MFILKENKKIINIGALIFLINGLFYLTGEYVAALGTGYSLKEVYLRNFISSLGVYPNLIVEGVPVGFSKLAIIMNIDFIVTGIGFLVAYYFLIFKMLNPKKYSLLYLITPVLFAVGSVLVGVYQGGVPSEDGLHGLGARLSFLGGNLTLIISGVSLFKNRKGYSIVSIILGLIGLISASFMNNALTNNLSEVVAIYERLTVYPITIWQLMTGLTFLKENK
ncbi:DUF998 domain-containing protein [Gemella sanguinis]|jgi:hypothetical protein|uniref:DUF998 domain-containing protein n=1 Tax=Gemella sanguinis TaxID=84135 RepID=A0ABX6FL77_9BACL|nr:DUF998 domain-containing protein [Gemella sanguinis]